MTLSNILSLLGILMVTVGTVATLLNVLCTKSKYVGTALWYDNQNETFKEMKKEVIIGCFFIILGGVLQCIAIFL